MMTLILLILAVVANTVSGQQCNCPPTSSLTATEHPQTVTVTCPAGTASVHCEWTIDAVTGRTAVAFTNANLGSGTATMRNSEDTPIAVINGLQSMPLTITNGNDLTQASIVLDATSPALTVLNFVYVAYTIDSQACASSTSHTLNTESLCIASPNFPDKYPNSDSVCTWNIQTSSGVPMDMEVFIQTETGVDTVTISSLNPDNTVASTLYTGSGVFAGTLTPPSQSVRVVYVVDDGDNAPGFVVCFTPQAAPCLSDSLSVDHTDITGSDTVSGSTRSYSCASGYVKTSGEDPSIVTCTNGVWSLPNIGCGPAPCLSDPLSVDHTDITGSDTVSGSTRSYSCASGYVKTSGEDPSIVTCTNGVWSLPTIGCGPAPCLSDPLSVDHTDITGSDTVSGSTRSYSCASGYVKTSGEDPSIVTCTNGVWSLPTIGCGPAPCLSDPLSVDHTDITGSDTVSGSTRSYSCASGYVKTSGEDPSIVTCTNGVWSLPTIGCGPAPCLSDPLSVDHTDITGSDTVSGSTRSYSCGPGYVKTSGEDPSIVTCTNGVWSLPNITCERPGCGRGRPGNDEGPGCKPKCKRGRMGKKCRGGKDKNNGSSESHGD